MEQPSEGKSSRAEDPARVLDVARQTPTGILLVTLEAPPRVVYANPAALSLLRCEDADLALPEHSHLRPLLADWLTRSSDCEQSWAFETELPAGMRASVRATTVDTDDGSLDAFFFEPSSAPEREQSLLQRHEERFRSLVESAQEAVWIQEANRLLYANPAALALFGVADRQAVLGADLRQFLHPEDQTELERRFEQLTSQGAPQVAFECRARSEHQAWMTLEVSAIPIEYLGRPTMLAFARNITEQKSLDRRIRQHDRLAALGMLAGGIAHAINNPLSYVLLNLDHLAKELPRLELEPAYAGEALSLVQQSYAAAERMAGVVRRTREFCRVDESDPGPVDVAATVSAVVEMVGNEIRHRGSLELELEDVPSVFGARARLEQALLSLLIFAARSLPEGHHDSNVVRVGLRYDESRVLVEVRCTCLVPLYPPPRPAPGAEPVDLGLLACEGIVASFGGSLGIAIETGPVTLFQIALPILLPAT